jgi:hypothetical protein
MASLAVGCRPSPRLQPNLITQWKRKALDNCMTNDMEEEPYGNH